MPLSNSTEDIEITIANNPVGKESNKNLMSVEPDGSQWSFHQVNMKIDSLRINLRPENKTVKLTAYLRETKRPTAEKYLYKWSIPDNSSCGWNNDTQHFGEIIDILNVDSEEYTCKTDPYIIFVSDKENLSGKYILGEQFFIIQI